MNEYSAFVHGKKQIQDTYGFTLNTKDDYGRDLIASGNNSIRYKDGETNEFMETTFDGMNKVT